ncbi:MAG TPA: hypothetical protein VFW00_00945, partial [Rhodocyclaceae bacterium]|nr:hypothetical protein [Rhodocyclaceae bacterium]
MQNTSNFLPWVLSVLLAVLWGMSWNDSKTTIEKKDAEITTLQQLVNEANRKVDVANLQTRQLVTEANSKIHQMAEEANARIQLANQPEIPIRVFFRKAIMSSGNVAGFNNMSGQTIAVTINVNRATGQSRSFDLTLDPGITKEIGEREGWAFIPGDTITVAQAGHKS